MSTIRTTATASITTKISVAGICVLAMLMATLSACDQLNRPFNTGSSSSTSSGSAAGDDDGGAGAANNEASTPAYTPQPGDVQL